MRGLPNNRESLRIFMGLMADWGVECMDWSVGQLVTKNETSFGFGIVIDPGFEYDMDIENSDTNLYAPFEYNTVRKECAAHLLSGKNGVFFVHI